VLLISETHFTERTYFSIPYYKIYTTNHPDGTAHGGTAILIKHTLKHYEILKYIEDFLQTTSVKVSTLPYELTITAVYCPPKHNIQQHDFQNFFQTLGPKFLAGGDHNSKNTMWGSRLTTTKGRELAKTLEANNYSFLSTGAPTYWPMDPNKNPDLLNFFIINGINTIYTDVVQNYDLTSDHSPVIATTGTSIALKKPTPQLHNFRIKWDAYRGILSKEIKLNVRLKDSDDIENATVAFIKLLQEAVQQATPPIKPRLTLNAIPLDIKRLVAEKREA
jgi:hypothetical protein